MCVCVSVCLCDLQRPSAVTQTGVMNSALTYPSCKDYHTNYSQVWECDVLFQALSLNRTCGVNVQGHEHTHTCQHAWTRTCIHRWGSSAFNPSPLVSGGDPVQGPCPLYWSDWTWGGLPHNGLSSERRHICGEWKVNGSRRKIDRGHSGTRQSNQKTWVGCRGFRTIWHTEQWQKPD